MEGSNARQARLLYRFGKQPLKEIFLESHPELARPFQGANAVRRFPDACGIEINIEVSIMFAHNDLVSPNILLSPGPNPKEAAIIDWAQAGWYPAYWEYYKARRVRVDPYYFDDAGVVHKVSANYPGSSR
ncbi:phosphotransferase enzyme family protein [Penicillium samsonianum]|uniref:phosphotransferase enzyme family protein n=1 Tax=Penicillium samsonianum TaxID=1882272 RepID=UPI0025496B6E|nr:phosphotransferase enzyme family protein [Penicillium samsonianum]KAJ6137216.1 phosphotransferase enzyme family protein [Penicillium samsonianum]